MSNRKRREKMKLTQTRKHPRISPTGSVRKRCTTKMRSSSSAAKIRAARKARCRRLCGRSSAQRAPELAGLRDAQVAGALNAMGGTRGKCTQRKHPSTRCAASRCRNPLMRATPAAAVRPGQPPAPPGFEIGVAIHRRVDPSPKVDVILKALGLDEEIV